MTSWSAGTWCAASRWASCSLMTSEAWCWAPAVHDDEAAGHHDDPQGADRAAGSGCDDPYDIRRPHDPYRGVSAGGGRRGKAQANLPGSAAAVPCSWLLAQADLRAPRLQLPPPRIQGHHLVARPVHRRVWPKPPRGPVDPLRNRHAGQTATVVGKGPSLLTLTPRDFGSGPVIAINHAILEVRKLGLRQPALQPAEGHLHGAALPSRDADPVGGAVVQVLRVLHAPPRHRRPQGVRHHPQGDEHHHGRCSGPLDGLHSRCGCWPAMR